jgi:glyoxylase-like metal-dependent hydrolase (beta-lactamase superfamily II)
MKLGNPIRVVNGVFQIRALGSRVTALIGDDRAILVDAGMKGSAGLILSGLQELRVAPDSVTGVVVTHYHPDHAGGVQELVYDRDITVMAHRIDARILAGAVEQPNPFQHKLMARLTAPVLEKVNGPPTPIDTELEDGDIIPFDFPVQVVHTPGHTAGSIAIFLPDRKLLIIGDALQYRLGRRLTPPAAAVTQDPEQAMESLRKLLKLDFHTICFSHYPPFHGGARAALRQMIDIYTL